MNTDEPLKIITKRYTTSRDFNGIAISSLAAKCGLSLHNTALIIQELVKQGKVTVELGDRHPNPYIKALEAEAVETQLTKLDKYLQEVLEETTPVLRIPFGEANEIVLVVPKNNFCVYPSMAHL